MAITPSTDLAAIKRKVRLPDLARSLGVRVLSNGRVAHCFNPAGHRNGDANPSLQLHDDGFVCHGCGIKGDVFDMFQQLQACDFVTAKKRLAELAGVGLSGPPARSSGKVTRRELAPWPPERLDAMAKVWDVVRDLPLTPAAEAWLKSRGIRAAVAHEVGCRDFAPAIKALANALEVITTEARPKTGFFSNGGEPWFPLRRLLADGLSTGLCFPSFMPGYAFPLAWRWRFFEPIDLGKGPTVKVMAQPATGCHVLPLGLDRVTSFRGKVIICEGEPDFLSLLEVSVRSGLVIEAVGICDMSTGWRGEWTKHIAAAERIIVAAHDTENGRQLARQVGCSLVEHIGTERAAQVFARKLFDEDQDANDKLNAGQLDAWLTEILRNG